MLLACTLLIQFGATPVDARVGVLVARRTAVSELQARATLVQLGQALTDAGVRLAVSAEEIPARAAGLGVADTAACDGKRACVVGLGKQLSLSVVVAVSVGDVLAERGVVLEAYRVSDGVVLARGSAVTGADTALTQAQVQPFVSALQRALSAGEVPHEALEAPPSVSTRRWPAYLTLCGAVVASVISVASSIAGAQALGQVQVSYATPVNGLRASSLRASQMESLLGASNDAYLASAVSAVLAVVLGGVTVWLW